MMPAAMGAEADVPVWLSVHRCLRSVVIWKTKVKKKKNLDPEDSHDHSKKFTHKVDAEELMTNFKFHLSRLVWQSIFKELPR